MNEFTMSHYEFTMNEFIMNHYGSDGEGVIRELAPRVMRIICPPPE